MARKSVKMSESDVKVKIDCPECGRENTISLSSVDFRAEECGGCECCGSWIEKKLDFDCRHCTATITVEL